MAIGMFQTCQQRPSLSVAKIRHEQAMDDARFHLLALDIKLGQPLIEFSDRVNNLEAELASARDGVFIGNPTMRLLCGGQVRSTSSALMSP
ncbi:hypothetical protein EAS62_26895 [Bradyrhizobium zhanjiangense]|uniref:Uncharacterized protein n=1 Tax=Bradyrhizobium zhanjiangense TaxID=1325107 RepID=A0ABY0DGC0_9BRAD|nr:hypothetical protein EAS62_26895 [Bradyrhizobium zhanjiangense]